MRKALINNLSNDKKITMSTFSVEVHFAEGETKTHEIRNYTFENAFEAIREIYDGNEASAKKIIIEIVEGR